MTRYLYVGTGAGDTIDIDDSGGIVVADAGDDTVTGGAARDIVRGGSGADTISGGGGGDVLRGGSGNDNISGDAGNDVLLGDADNDIIDGGDRGRRNRRRIARRDRLPNGGFGHPALVPQAIAPPRSPEYPWRRVRAPRRRSSGCSPCAATPCGPIPLEQYLFPTSVYCVGNHDVACMGEDVENDRFPFVQRAGGPCGRGRVSRPGRRPSARRMPDDAGQFLGPRRDLRGEQKDRRAGPRPAVRRLGRGGGRRQPRPEAGNDLPPLRRRVPAPQGPPCGGGRVLGRGRRLGKEGDLLLHPGSDGTVTTRQVCDQVSVSTGM